MKAQRIKGSMENDTQTRADFNNEIEIVKGYHTEILGLK